MRKASALVVFGCVIQACASYREEPAVENQGDVAGGSEQHVARDTTAPPWAGFLVRASSAETMTEHAQEPVCGVSLVGPDTAVTAAACVYDPANQKLLERAALGVRFPHSTTPDAVVRVRTVATPLGYIKPGVTPRTLAEVAASFESDVAVLKLETALPTVALPSIASELPKPHQGASSPLGAQPCESEVFGYGRDVREPYDGQSMSYGGKPAGRSVNVCVQVSENLNGGTPKQVGYESLFSKETKTPDVTLCVGDSGAALFETKNGKDTIVGIHQAVRGSAPGCDPKDETRRAAFVPLLASVVESLRLQAEPPLSAPTPPTPPPPECMHDGECNPGNNGSGMICSTAQKCVPGCKIDDQCPGTKKCVAGMCK